MRKASSARIVNSVVDAATVRPVRNAILSCAQITSVGLAIDVSLIAVVLFALDAIQEYDISVQIAIDARTIAALVALYLSRMTMLPSGHLKILNSLRTRSLQDIWLPR